MGILVRGGCAPAKGPTTPGPDPSPDRGWNRIGPGGVGQGSTKGGATSELSPECRRLRALLEPHLDGELGEEPREFARQHLSACPYCGPREDFARRFRDLVRDSVGEESLPPGLLERVSAALEDEDEA